ncbi:hypothetical protein D7V93_19770 [Corallococcus llansteffanensis]|uniref:Uncharacterized protein n=1 Tax=Corallococcus llansteffanensis TaxID=2316731 RepID=A0A3A8PN55_9BACT|nr:hypothetical protein D7V93_19770 [Corallococcus llansteffanensis]
MRGGAARGVHALGHGIQTEGGMEAVGRVRSAGESAGQTRESGFARQQRGGSVSVHGVCLHCGAGPRLEGRGPAVRHDE